MGTFTDPILADDGELVRESIHSPNYVPDTAGWSINKDGTADMADGKFRGTVQVGTPGQAGSVYIGPKSGDPILNIIPLADSGQIAYGAPNMAVSDTMSATIDPGGSSFEVTRQLWGDNVAGPPGFGLVAKVWRFFADMATMTAQAFVGQGFTSWVNSAEQVEYTGVVKVRGGAANPALPVVTAPATATGRMHWDAATVATNLSGIGMVTHGAGFTPQQVMVGQNGVSGSSGIVLLSLTGSITSTTFQIKAVKATDGTEFNGSVGVTFACFG